MACNGKGCNEASGSQGTTAVTQGGTVGKGLDIDAIAQKRGSLLVPACIVVPLTKISSLVGVSADAIDIADSSPKDANPSHSSCFFKWEDFDVVSAGILLQVRINPLGEDEYPDYIKMFIDSKRDMGERTIEGEVDKFITFEGFGDDGAYSYSSGKYFWQLGNKVLMSIAFNTSHTPEEQYKIATGLATEMVNNYANGF